MALIKSISAAILISLAIMSCAKNDVADAVVFDGKGVVASVYPMRVAALNIADGSEGIHLAGMSSPEFGGAHGHDLTPADAALIEKASVLIVNGRGIETFVDRALAINGNLTVIDASADIAAASDSVSHVWMSVGSHIRQIEAIARGLAAWDTDNAKTYSDNARSYAARLTVLREWALGERMSFGKHGVVLAHDGFLGLAGELGLTVAAIVEKAHGAEPEAADVAAVIDAIRSATPAAIIAEKGVSSSAVNAIAAETGLPVFELEMITDGPIEKDAYVSAVERNVGTLKKALE